MERYRGVRRIADRLVRFAKSAERAVSWFWPLHDVARKPDGMRAALRYIVNSLPPPRIIYDRAGVSPYLSRWYLLGAPKAVDGLPVFREDGNPRKVEWKERSGPIAIYLHQFHRGDDDNELHNHPWHWSFAIILAGGYVEERRIGNLVVPRKMKPGSVNFIEGSDYHRVDLVQGDSWSLFIAGPRASSWCFWNRETNEETPWREFIARKRGVDVGAIS
jgi:hypothetical protein